jgi:hypothetical protein
MKKMIVLVCGCAITAWGLYISAKPIYIWINGKTGTGIVTALHTRSNMGQNTSRNFFKPGKQPYISFLPEGQKDSIRFLAAGGGQFMDNYKQGEQVTVVYNRKDISQHALFSLTEISSGTFAILFGVILLLAVFKPNTKNKNSTIS